MIPDDCGRYHNAQGALIASKETFCLVVCAPRQDSWSTSAPSVTAGAQRLFSWIAGDSYRTQSGLLLRWERFREGFNILTSIINPWLHRLNQPDELWRRIRGRSAISRHGFSHIQTEAGIVGLQ